jgi:hypothetical protein
MSAGSGRSAGIGLIFEFKVWAPCPHERQREWKRGRAITARVGMWVPPRDAVFDMRTPPITFISEGSLFGGGVGMAPEDVDYWTASHNGLGGRTNTRLVNARSNSIVGARLEGEMASIPRDIRSTKVLRLCARTSCPRLACGQSLWLTGR